MYKIVNGKKVRLTKRERDARALEESQVIEEKERRRYIGLRRREYPSIEDQLDIIYHEGLQAWKLEIAKIKDKYPKPTHNE